eukprot:Hpha_TRINITY_DN16680_c2_g6::TRINITY_DN16680_c2_g6_i1::g.182353::m.182353
MKIALGLLALASPGAGRLLTAEYVEGNVDSLWMSFKATYRRNYTVSEEVTRKAVFRQNMLTAVADQARHPRATFGATRFSDFTEDEFYPYAHGLVHAPDLAVARPPALYTKEEIKQLKASMDWRTKGAVTPVKDQGQCGSCWAFSTTGVTESHNYLHGDGKLTQLSEQEFVSCQKGCNGGSPVYAYLWALRNHNGSIATEASYPYASQDGKEPPCASDVASKPVGATIRDYKLLPSDEDQMAVWLVANGPISIAIDAATGWMNYKGGVLTGCTAGTTDHAVLIVGVTDEYWIVKNSWGTSWGESGYARLQFGTNQCNIKDSPSAPLL